MHIAGSEKINPQSIKSFANMLAQGAVCYGAAFIAARLHVTATHHFRRCPVRKKAILRAAAAPTTERIQCLPQPKLGKHRR